MAFDDTQDLERSLLNILLGSQVFSRMYVVTVKESWFTSKERKFIISLALEMHKSSRSLLTRQIFDYEIQNRLAAEEVDFYRGEWDLIQGLAVQEDAEALIERLKEAQAGREIMDLAEGMFTLLEKNDVSGADALLKRGAMGISVRGGDRPVVEITEYQERLQLLKDKKAHPEKYLGIKTGFPTFDEHTGGLFPKELTLVAGLTGLGKSTFVRAFQKGIVLCNANKNVLHVANEESQEQVEMKFDSLLTETPYLDFKLATISDEGIDAWVKYMDEDMKEGDRGRIFVKEVPAFTNVTLMEQAFRDLEGKGIRIHVIIIDHLPHVKPIERAYDPNDEQRKAAADCKELARSLGISVVIPTQAATIVAQKTEAKKRAGDLDVYGSKAQIHVANTFLIITDKGIDESDTTQEDLEEWQRDRHWLCDVKKNRDGPRFNFWAKHFVQIGDIQEWDQMNALNVAADTTADSDDKKPQDDDEKPQDAPSAPEEKSEVEEVSEPVETTPEDMKALQEASEEEYVPPAGYIEGEEGVPEVPVSVLTRMRERKSSQKSEG
jgi:replicative DNA helicase